LGDLGEGREIRAQVQLARVAQKARIEIPEKCWESVIERQKVESEFGIFYGTFHFAVFAGNPGRSRECRKIEPSRKWKISSRL